MKLVTNKNTIVDILGELMLEYTILEANPFAAAEKDAGGGDAGGDEGGGDEGGEEEKKEKPKGDGNALTIKFDPSTVKKYNTNTDWRSGEGEVKKISKKGLEVDVDGNTIQVNFDDLTEVSRGATKMLYRHFLKEAEEKSAEDKKMVADLEAEMGSIANELGSAFDSAQDEIEKEVEEMPEDKLNEHKQKLNEAIGVTAVIGFILALPKLVELITKAVAKLVKLIKKFTGGKDPQTDEEKADWASIVIDFTHKWHKLYIKAFYYMFKFSGLYKKAGIKDEPTRMKVASVMYYTVVAGLAVAAGVGAVGAFKAGVSQAAHGGEFALGTFESVMAAVKSGEVAEFMGLIGAS